MELLLGGVAVFYTFLNGLHDAPLVLAQVVSTHSMGPRKALVWIGILEFLGVIFFSHAVLKTMSFGHLSTALAVSTTRDIRIFVLACFVAALFFNGSTWYLGLPSSSSQALFGAMAGAALALGLGGAPLLVQIAKLVGVLMASAAGATLLAWLVTWALYSLDIPYIAGSAIFPFFNALSSGILALLHGANDAPKSLGLYLVAARYAHGTPSQEWGLLLLFAGALSAGILFGENRILRTVGLKLFRMRVLQGAGANAASFCTLGLCTAMGFPVSFTHILVGAIAGSGTAKNFHSVRWGVAGEILLSWVITLPISMLLGFCIAKFIGGCGI